MVIRLRQATNEYAPLPIHLIFDVDERSHIDRILYIDNGVGDAVIRLKHE